MIGSYIRPNDPKVIQFVMPLVIAIAFLVLADIHSPRRGIKVQPQSLISLVDSLGPR